MTHEYSIQHEPHTAAERTRPTSRQAANNHSILHVLLDSEADEPGRFLEINPVPGFKDMHVLQCLVPLPVELRERADVLARYLLDLNAEVLSRDSASEPTSNYSIFAR